MHICGKSSGKWIKLSEMRNFKKRNNQNSDLGGGLIHPKVEFSEKIGSVNE